VEDLDREDERLTLLDSGGGLTVGVTVGRGHYDRDRGSNLLSPDGFLKTWYDSAEREVNRLAQLRDLSPSALRLADATRRWPVAGRQNRILDGARPRQCGTRRKRRWRAP